MLARLILTCAAFALALTSAHATDYTESIDGEFSGDRLNPTRIALTYGAFSPNGVAGYNVISGTLGMTGSTIDRDYFTVTVPDGFALSQLRVGNQTTVGGTTSFLGIATGATMPVAPDATSAAGLLGWKLYGAADRNTDILGALGIAGNGASGFAGPLVAGDYTVWLQERSSGTYNYRFNFVISPVPEPAQHALILAGLGLLWMRRLAMLRGRTG